MARTTCPTARWLEIIGARHNNLRNIDVQIPLGTLTAVTGVSGSGKSSLVEDVLYNSLARTLHRARMTPAPHDAIRGIEQINKVIRVDQQPLGQHADLESGDVHRRVRSDPRAVLPNCPRRRFAATRRGGSASTCPAAAARAARATARSASRCTSCPTCGSSATTCRGRRYNPETLAVRYHGQSIADVLDMSCGRAVKLFENIPKIRRILQTLCDVGLDYLTLGQPAPTLSGGEAQRVKLAAELSRPDTGRTLYLLDEPTTGLHFDDLAKLLDVLNRLVDLGNTVVVIEHNLDVIKTADWVIDMGPEAGEGGGYVVAAGTPEEIVGSRKSEVRDRKSEVRSSKATAGDLSLAGSLANRTSFEIRSQAHRALTPPKCSRRCSPLGHTRAEAARFRRGRERRARRTSRFTRSAIGEDALGGRRPPLAHRRIASAAMASHAAGTARFWPASSIGSTNWANSLRPIGTAAASSKSGGEEIRRLVLPRHHRRAMAVEAQVPRGRATFKREDLISRIGLKPLNELDTAGLWHRAAREMQEPSRAVAGGANPSHSLAEIDHPKFWSFLEEAVAGFQKFTHRIEQRPEDVMPWKVLGRKWHFARKGFPPGKRIHWDAEVLEELCELLSAAAPEGQFLWNNQQLVHVFVAGRREPWASIHTKRLASVDLQLNGPKGRFGLGRITEIGAAQNLETARDFDYMQIRFRTLDDLHRGDLPGFLAEHLAAVGSGNGAPMNVGHAVRAGL